VRIDSDELSHEACFKTFNIKQNNLITAEILFDKLQFFDRRNFLMMADSKDSDSDDADLIAGLASSHAYAVL
jgi:hypothetical protein